jgi:hypothetical protein
MSVTAVVDILTAVTTMSIWFVWIAWPQVDHRTSNPK